MERLSKGINSLTLSLGAACIRLPIQAEGHQLALKEAAAAMPKGLTGIAAQWFEMESLIRRERMMRIFGYTNNEVVCSHLRQISKKESPNRTVRCTPSN